MKALSASPQDCIVLICVLCAITNPPTSPNASWQATNHGQLTRSLSAGFTMSSSVAIRPLQNKGIRISTLR